MRKMFSLLILFTLFVTGRVSADEFNNTTSFDSYRGGYYTDTRAHWTAYSVRYGGTVGAGIKILNYDTEVNTGSGSAHITSQYNVSPYVLHQHTNYTF